MKSLALALGALSLLTLLALLLAVTALCQVRSLSRAIAKGKQAEDNDLAASLQALRSDVEGLSSQVHDTQSSQTVIAAPKRGALNLGKRSQALRLNRHGSSPAQIAAALEIPLQEVELLLKVDRIVLSNL